MNEVVKPSRTSDKPLSERMKEFLIKDPALGLFHVSDMGQVFEIAEAMAKSGVMVPKHCAGNMGVCVGITMRALHWGFDPFGLANESFQASDSSPVAFQAKVFTAALRHVTGIDLRYRYEGTVAMSDKPALSAKGNMVARRAATGDRKCIAYTKIDGDVLEYETPILDHIGIKNSALWHNDPDQQLGYFAGRGWIRRYRSEVILGAMSVDEVQDNPGMRDVTPRETGFAQMAERARLQAAKGDPDNTIDGEVEEENTPSDGEQAQEGEAVRPDESSSPAPTEETEDAGEDESNLFRIDDSSQEFKDGMAAAQEGFDKTDCPHKEDAEKAATWVAGWEAA